MAREESPAIQPSGKQSAYIWETLSGGYSSTNLQSQDESYYGLLLLVSRLPYLPTNLPELTNEFKSNYG